MLPHSLPLKELTEPRRERASPQAMPDAPYVGMDCIDSGARRVTNFERCASYRSDGFRFYSGDVLYGRLRPYLNKVWNADREGICSGEFIVLPSTSRVDGGFLAHALRQSEFVAFATDLNRGDRPRVTFDQIADYEFSVPPLDEQRRITKKLDHIATHLDDTRARLETVPVILKRFRMSVLAAAFSGRLTESWRESNAGVTNGRQWLIQQAEMRMARFMAQKAMAAAEGRRMPRQLLIPAPLDDVGDFPSTWSVCPLATLFSVETGGTPSRKVKSYWEGGTIPWVKTGEVQNCDIFEAEECVTPLALVESNAKVFPAETLLIAMYGEGKTRGQVGRLKIPAATNQACAALVNEDLGEVSRSYAYYFCLGQYQKLRDDAVGGNQPNLNLDKIKNWVIAIPPPEEQAQIVRRIGAMFKQADAIEARYGKAKTFADKLMPSVLGKAFRGELS